MWLGRVRKEQLLDRSTWEFYCGRRTSGALQRSKRLGFERLLSKFLIGLGAVVGILGGVAVVLEAIFPGTL